jgi:MFS transporter, DHA2 family, multidrug resistance protein
MEAAEQTAPVQGSPVEAAPEYQAVESGSRLVILVIAIMLATLLQTLDGTIVNVALPVIQGNLGATFDEGAWVVTGYIISAVVILPITPWLQLRFGRRQYYATAIFGFTIASVLCGLSSSIGTLIFWRIVQGAFGGGLIATGQAALRDSFPPDKLGLSQGIFALGAIVGPTVGPTLGGLLTDNFSWNYVFLINIVPGTIAGIVILAMMKNPTKPRRVPLDTVGLALLVIGLGSLQFILDEGQRRDWFNDDLIVALACTALAGIVAFVCWELFGAKYPVVDLRALRYRSVMAGSALALVMGASLFGTIVLLPQYVQSILNFTATLSGELILVRAAVTGILTMAIVRLVGTGRIDSRILLAAGFALIAASNIWLGDVSTSNTPFWSLGLPLMLGGAGLALLFIPLSIAVLRSVPGEVAPKATAFVNLSLQLGGSISTAGLVTLLAHREAFHQTILAANVTLHNSMVRDMVVHHELNKLYQAIIQQANTMAFADASFLVGIATFFCIPLVFLMERSKAGPAARH